MVGNAGGKEAVKAVNNRAVSGKQVTQSGQPTISQISKDPAVQATRQGGAPQQGASAAIPLPQGDQALSAPLTSPPGTSGEEQPGVEGTEDEGKEKRGAFSAVDSLKRIGTTFRRLVKGKEEEVHLVKRAKEAAEVDQDLPPELQFKEDIDLDDPYVMVKVYLNPITSEYIYHPVEPKLAPKQEEIRDFIINILNKALSYRKEAMQDPVEKAKFLQGEIDDLMDDYSVMMGPQTEDFMGPVLYYIRREYIGYGKIHCLMLDPGVEDISCDGTGIPVFVYHRDYGSIRTTIEFDTDEELEGFVVSLAQRANKNITVADPILDATLPEGHRLNATFGREVTTRGCSFTIRKFKEDPLTITDLVKFGTLSSQMAAHFWLSVQYGESMIFAGGTASGKTATMNAISIFIPTSAKIISIEDTREVNLPHQNWIAGITRGGAEGGREGDIDMYDLLRAALRQRPEYVLVGEVRGKETMTMFQAMATGHTTYSTMHADSVKSIVYRLENPPISIPRVLIQALNLVAIHNQLRVQGRRARRITELVEIVGIEPTSLEVITNRVYRWEPAGDLFDFGGHSNLYEKIMDMEDMTRDEVVFELNRRSEVIDWLVRNNVRQYIDVSKIVAEYYESAEKVMNILRENSTIDIEKGLNIFEERPKDILPPPEMQQALPEVPKKSGVEIKGGP